MLLANSMEYKQQLARHFSRAAHTYDDYADFQQQVLLTLSGYLKGIQCQMALDLGCGTGNAINILKSSCEQVVGLDLSEEMLSVAQTKHPQVDFVCGDAEQYPFMDGRFDLIFSNLAIQWIERQDRLLINLHRSLKKQGYFCFSTLCEGSMPEITTAWHHVDGRLHSNQYPAAEDIRQEIVKAGFSLIESKIQTVTMYFETVAQSIDSLRKVGASLIVDQANKAPVSPALWKSFVQSYETMRHSSGIPLSYQVVFFLIQKKG